MAEMQLPKPGVACEPCRQRKSKCDRTRPNCEACASSSTLCIFIDKRPKRGPQKGQLQALKAQVAVLKRQLAQHVPGEAKSSEPENAGLGLGRINDSDRSVDTKPDINIDPRIATNIDTVAGAAPETMRWLENLDTNADTHIDAALDAEPETMSWLEQLPNMSSDTACELTECAKLSPDMSTMSVLHTPALLLPMDGGEVILSGMTRAELDAIYFERIHPFAPMIHKRRFFSWADEDNTSPARSCLHLAMWTLAAAVSSQFQYLCDSLYASTRQKLYRLGGDDGELPWATPKTELEQVQAWLLLAYFEFLRMERHQVLLTATSTFRLAQLMRLHNVDVSDPPSDVGPGPDHVWAAAEEKRRTFWLAFGFNRLLSAQDGLSFTLQEEPIAITASLDAKSIGLKESNGFWKRHNWLTAAVQNRLKPLTEAASEPRDVIAAYNHILGRDIVVHLGDTAVTWVGQNEEQRVAIKACEQMAYQSAVEIAHIGGSLPRLSAFRDIHISAKRLLEKLQDGEQCVY
ncbi:hypothetical protein AK830_g8768 [Neonectria ditissima]|uniref:Zn(2)-C6 fungal-type domain-containing protein n=1 Tax=Neonectria ditissima TaxID=78410 RepID=A0A0P7AK19_9HYPO|nr:hypothetical protein AK830_g8768 [Neonectria ditissima]